MALKPGLVLGITHYRHILPGAALFIVLQILSATLFETRPIQHAFPGDTNWTAEDTEGNQLNQIMI